MAEFLRRNRILLTAGVLLFVSLVLLSSSARSSDRRDPLARFLLDGIAPLQGGITFVRLAARHVWNGYLNLVSVHEQNEDLKREIVELEQQLVRLSELELSQTRLEDLLAFKDRVEGTAVSARVIGRDPLPWARTLTIDRGKRDGIENGMAVLSPGGVVGQISEAGWMASRVLLLTDHNSGIDAIVQRTRARGILQGALEEGCHMKYLRRTEDAAVGDLVVTAGLDNVFPKGVLIGEVTEISRYSRDALHGAVVRPSVALDRIEEVLVVTPSSLIEGSEP